MALVSFAKAPIAQHVAVKTSICNEEFFNFFLSKALVYYCFLVFRHIGECIFLDLF